MNRKKMMSIAVIAGLIGSAGHAVAVVDEHGEIEGPFNSPMDVTNTCLECHEAAATQVMATSHWKWEVEQEVNGKVVKRGKKNVLNNFCISINSNWPRCTSCHVGYGWEDDSFDFTDQSRVDCLVCHDTTGTYKKPGAGAGMPAGFTGKKKMDKNPVNLLKVAQNVGLPSRDNCLSCHANGGGGNNVKHGDIDQSLIKPTASVDVHMGTDGLNFNCGECHKADAHKIPGNSLIVSPGGNTPVGCVDCHDAAPHTEARMSGALNMHTEKVSCQTCHIPEFAKVHGTKMSWDWSKAKNPKELAKDQRVIKEHGHKVYIFKKGKFTYEDNVAPSYAWFNGKAGAYQMGDKIEPGKVTLLNYPLGDRSDASAKIHPFKIHKGNQIFDKKNSYLITPKVFGFKGDKDAFWKNFDWNKAAIAGMNASGLEYSGEYDFTPTETYWAINHMVSPAEDALRCLNCHGVKGRMNWQELGYDMDPMEARKRK